MEVFIEQIVRKRRTFADTLIVLALAVASVILSMFLFLLSAKFSMLGTIFIFAIAAVFYFAYILATSRNLEYEYSMVNHEIDIDKIMNQKRRKRLITLNVKKMEAFGKKGRGADYEKYISDSSVKKIYACADKTADNVFYAVYFNEGTKYMLIFSPKQEIVDMIVKFNPREKFDI